MLYRTSLYQRLLTKILVIFYRLLYNQFAWTYDWIAALVSLGMWQQWVLSVLPYLAGPRVLELGHGPGHLQLALHKLGITPYGLDLSPYMSFRSGVLLKRSGFLPLLVNGYAQFMSFAPNSFDQVVSTFPSEYIFAPATIAEIKRILVPGGILVILPNAWITGTSRRHRAAAWLFRVTNQAPQWEHRFLEPLRQAGFTSLSTDHRSLHSNTSHVMIITAMKPIIAI